MGRGAISERLAALEAALDPFLRSRGRPLVRLVPRDLAPDPATGRIAWTCTPPGGRPVLVTLTPREGRLLAGCACEQFATHGQCKHAAALVVALRERLRVRPLRETEGAAEADVTWRVRLLRGRVDVVPLVRTGPGQPPTPLDDRLRARGPTSPAERAAQALLAQERGAPPSAMTLLERLCGGGARVEVEGRGAVELAAGRAGVVAVAARDAYTLRPALDGQPLALWPGLAALAPGALVGLLPGSTALRFARVTPEAAALLAAAAEGDALTVEALLALVDRIEAADTGLAVDLPPALRGREVTPATTIALQVAPEGAAGGAVVTLRARPLAGGPALVPGEGAPRVTALVGGERLLARRDLAGEVAAGRALARALGLDPAAPAHAIPDGERLLDLLDAFEALGADAALEWAADAQPRRPVRGALTLSAREGAGFLDLDGGLMVEGQLVGLAVLLAAAREGRRWAPIGCGRFVELRRLLAGRLLDLALVAQEGPDDAPRLSAAAVVVAAPALEAAPAAPSLRAALERVRACLTADAEPPRDLMARLRPHQRDGWRWLSRLSALGAGALLADEVGLGKTVQAIALLLARRDAGPALVLAPTSVVFNWERELRRFAPSLAVHVHAGQGRMDRLDALGPGDVLLSGWALLARDVEWLALPAWGTLVLDEAQALKNADSLTSRSARRLRAGFALALTATPLENHLGELWSVLEAVVPGLLGTRAQFQARFADPIAREGLRPPGPSDAREGLRSPGPPDERERDAGRREALARVLRPFTLRRTQAEALPELPPRVEERVDVDLGGLERAVYERVRLDAVAALGTGGMSVRLLGALTRLREAATHARLVDPQAPALSAKLTVLLERLLPALAAGRRALVYSQFVRHLLLAQEALAARGVVAPLLRGSTPAPERATLVDAFQRGDAPLFLVSLKAGGTGLNLTAADLVVHLDPWWNPAAEEQATGRAHRLGQTRPVDVWRLVARGTIEEQVLELQEHKRDLATSALEGTDLAGRLTPDELLALVRDAARPAGASQ